MGAALGARQRSLALLGANAWLGLVAFDARKESERAKAVARTIGVSLELLDNGQRARFGELGVFPEDADIPVGIVARLWAETGGLDELETEALLSELYSLSLLLSFDLDRRTVQLDDVIRQSFGKKPPRRASPFSTSAY